MTYSDSRPPPAWVERFLAALRNGVSVREAARVARIANATVYHRRTNHADFREAWEACQPADGRAGPQPVRAPRRTPARIDRFIEVLADTSNVTAAAEAASLSTSAIYRLRREDAAFARRWYAALAEGYDNLEMELLGRLRAGEDPALGGAGGGSARKLGPKFDTTAALRCLTAHRESVTREKGRRSLAEEVATIAAINAKIDRLRVRQEANRQAIDQARKAKAPARGKAQPATKTKPAATARSRRKTSHG